MKPSGLDLQLELGGAAPAPVIAVAGAAVPQPRAADSGDRPDLEIVIAQGNIVHTTSRLILLGQFVGSEPSSAWRSVDHVMEGALGRLSKRQAGVGPRGCLDVVPTGRYFIMADHVVFLSLGAISEFYTTETALEFAFENGVRGLLVCQVEEFATVLMGDNPPNTEDPEGKIRYALLHMLTGFLKALNGEKEGRRFRRLTIAETDSRRHEIIVREVNRLKDEGLFAQFPLQHEVKIFSENLREDISKVQGLRNNQLSLKTRKNDQTGESDRVIFTFSPCTPLAAVLEETGEGFDDASLAPIHDLAGAARPAARKSSSRDIDSVSQLELLADAVTRLIPKQITQQLTKYNDIFRDGKYPRLILLDDSGSAAIPWECMKVGNHHPALRNGFSRLFTTPKVKIVETMPVQSHFRVLLVVDPTNDLQGAVEEGRDLVALYQAEVPHAEFDILKGDAATVGALKAKLEESYYHVLHFAGHSGYNRDMVIGTSGLRLSDGYFTGEDASLLSKTPGVVVFNSCESARINRSRSSGRGTGDAGNIQKEAERSVTIAEAFITGGIGHFIGTFWPVRDEAAEIFCRELYRNLAEEVPMGDAIIAARQALANQSMPDWANYIHYGDPDMPMFASSGSFS